MRTELGRGAPENIPRIEFLGWAAPLARAAADWLGKDPDRLRRTLVVAPTRQAGRRLRELLLESARLQGRPAVLGPRLATPDDFFRPPTRLPDCIRWAGWLKALEQTQDHQVANLFPAGIASRDHAWRLGIARQIEQARELLVSVNATFSRVADALEQDRDRWRELAELEREAVRAWQRWGFDDPAEAKRARAAEPRLPGIDRVVVAGVPDPTPLAVEAWQRLCRTGVPVTILVGAPPELAHAFDAWGRPKVEFWTDRKLHSAPEPNRLLVAADALGLAEAVVQCCADRSNRDIAVGVCDAAYLPALARRFREAGWTTYDPEGLPLARDSWPGLLEALADAVDAPGDFAPLARVARHPVLWDAWLTDCGARSALAALDDWEKRKGVGSSQLALEQLPAEKGEIHRALAGFLGKVRDLIEPAAGLEGEVSRSLADWLGRAPREVSEWAGVELAAWDCLRRERFGLSTRLRWLAASLGAIGRNADPSGAVLALQGWLELPFDPAPHVVLAGAHEGKVPEAPPANPLISEPVRETFGVRDRRSRLARDVFLYTALVESRRANGSVSVVNAQADPQGEPCRPSRVLLQARPEDLPRRVSLAIRDTPDLPLQPPPAWNRGDWHLRPVSGMPRNRAWEHISPSALKAYLDCPTRFYFSDVLLCEPFEPFRQELDGAAFGELLHRVFQVWGADPDAGGETDAARLASVWKDILHQAAAERFGSALPPVVRLQVMSAEERLQALAKIQAAQAGEGWRIIELEKRYQGDIALAGVPLKARVDRIDRHEDGRVRIIDYKTARRGLGPVEAHLRAYDETRGRLPLGPLVETGSRPAAWVDLQLPLYALTVQKALKLTALPKAYYCLLPEAVGDAEFAEFENLEGLVENALVWAEVAARRIVAGEFWPPAKAVQFDAFAAIAPEGLDRALGPEWADFLSTPEGARRGESRESAEPVFVKM